MKKSILIVSLLSAVLILFSFNAPEATKYSLTVKVNGLRNSTGNVQFTIYNKDGSIPDEDYENYYRQKNVTINKNSSSVTFTNLPKGKYAINILHDENKNGIIEKGWIFPVEGIGFSNYNSIGFANRPSFEGASFNLNANSTKTVKVIYM